MPPKSNVAGNSPTGGGGQISKRTPKVPQKSKTRTLIEQYYVSFIVGCAGMAFSWFVGNLVNVQILQKIKSLEANYASEKEARVDADNGLNLRLSIIEDRSNQQNNPKK